MADKPDTRPPHLDALLTEERVFRPLPRTLAEAALKPPALEAARRAAAENPLQYWEEAAEELSWFRKWSQVLDESNAPRYRWFPGAICNIAANALDRHVDTEAKNRLALIWEGEPGDTSKWTYYELYRAVNKVVGGLAELGVEKGDTVLLYMPPLPETVQTMLACAKLGAVHVVVFAGYAAKVLAERMDDAKPKVVVTVDGFYRNGRVMGLKAIVDEALALQSDPGVERVVVAHRANLVAPMTPGRDLWFEELVRRQPPEAPTALMEASDPLFMLHTSGATGRAKGVVHGHGGYMVGAHHTLKTVFDIKPTDIYWCTADPGWITGHSYGVYGPLLNGATTLLYEGHPLYPEPGRLWRTVERFGVTILYTVPTLIRMLKRFGPDIPRRHDLSTLRLLGTVGEPIAPEVWVWFQQHIGQGRCPVLDTYWQTETGMIMVAPHPVSPLKPGSVTRPLPGVEVAVLDDNGLPTPAGKGGHLVVTRPWPAMSTDLRGGKANLEDAWGRFVGPDGKGVYHTGDVARLDDDGYLWIQGRGDDVLNIAGHRIGSAELEAALGAHPAVVEAAVTPMPDPIRGEVAQAHVVLAEEKAPSEKLAQELIEHVRRELGAVAVMGRVVFAQELPKTRSGKLKRRALLEDGESD